MREHTHYPGVHEGWITAEPPPPPFVVTEWDVQAFRLGLSRLSARDRAIIKARAVGLSIPEVAAAHGIAPHSVKNVIWKAFTTLGVHVGKGVGGKVVPVHRFGCMARTAYLLGIVEGKDE
jgi:DNA-directed RNA polymerase specialized sigma24 family protein